MAKRMRTLEIQGKLAWNYTMVSKINKLINHLKVKINSSVKKGIKYDIF